MTQPPPFNGARPRPSRLFSPRWMALLTAAICVLAALTLVIAAMILTRLPGAERPYVPGSDIFTFYVASLCFTALALTVFGLQEPDRMRRWRAILCTVNVAQVAMILVSVFVIASYLSDGVGAIWLVVHAPIAFVLGACCFVFSRDDEPYDQPIGPLIDRFWHRFFGD